jgi:hypothetical protein
VLLSQNPKASCFWYDTISDLEITWNYSVALATEFFFAPSQRNNALFECDNAMFCSVACATEHFSPNFESSIPQASRIWRMRRRLVGMHRCAFLLRWVDCEQADQSSHGRDGHDPFFWETKSNFKGTLVLLDFTAAEESVNGFFAHRSLEERQTQFPNDTAR